MLSLLPGPQTQALLAVLLLSPGHGGHPKCNISLGDTFCRQLAIGVCRPKLIATKPAQYLPAQKPSAPICSIKPIHCRAVYGAPRLGLHRTFLL